MRVEDVMARDVKTASPEDSLKDVAGLLWNYEIGGMPVVDDRGCPLGVISKSDILVKERARPARAGHGRCSTGAPPTT